MLKLLSKQKNFIKKWGEKIMGNRWFQILVSMEREREGLVLVTRDYTKKIAYEFVSPEFRSPAPVGCLVKGSKNTGNGHAFGQWWRRGDQIRNCATRWHFSSQGKVNTSYYLGQRWGHSRPLMCGKSWPASRVVFVPSRDRSIWPFDRGGKNMRHNG